MSAQNKIIGIDLGTTNSCVFVIEDNGDKKNIPSNTGDRIIPSVVSYKGNERTVGKIAKAQAALSPRDTIFASKRLIGKSFTEFQKENTGHYLPFKVVADSNGMCAIELSNGKKVTPVEVAANVLSQIKKFAKEALHDTSEGDLKAVITVPAYFNDSQRQATKDAAGIAGLKVERIINEPTAAALAYGVNKSNAGKVAVYDLGGGTFDITILDIQEGVFEVLATNGNTHLGGEDFDNVIVDYIIKKENIDLQSLSENKRSEVIQRLREAAEKAKMDLSSCEEANIYIPFIYEQKSVNINLLRSTMEALVDPLIKKTLIPCENALKDVTSKDRSFTKDKIDYVILVGGMTKMPKVRETVKNFFNKQPSAEVNPDEAVAIGAAIQGSILSGKTTDVVLLDVTPLSLGLETLGGILTHIIPKNTTIPTAKSETFSTAEDNQTSVTIRIFQGERKIAESNKFLGAFDLTGIAPAPKGVPQIVVTFELDSNGILHVSAKDQKTGKEQSIKITGSGSLSPEEISRMKDEAVKFEEADNQKALLIETKNKLETRIYTAENMKKEHELKISEALKSELTDMIDQSKEKINGTVEEMQAQISKLDETLSKIGQEIYQAPQQEPSQPDQEV
jgi:molecular chaperone DnaK